MIPAGNHRGGSEMTMRWSYLGKLGSNGELDWGGNWDCNVPVRILPDLHETKLYLIIRGLAREGAHAGREVDWGASAIKVNGPEVMDILRSVYGDLERFKPKDTIGKYVQFARDLGSERFAAFIAAEL
jgi:hypothetical protein